MDDVVERRGMRAGATTDEYRDALSGEGEFGSLGYEWSDKPHRLVYDLCNEVDSLKSELSRLRTEKAPAPAESGAVASVPGAVKEGWRDISTAPKDGTAVLIWNPSSYQGKGGVFVALYFKTQDYGMQWICHPGYIRAEPTHWMPLPASPSPDRPAPAESGAVA